MSSLASFTGCLIGGAIGDALGYPVEFMSYDQIVEEHGKNGIEKPMRKEQEVAKISDETQMTLFTAEGLLWADVVKKRIGTSSIAAKCFCSYQRWLYTQGYPVAEPAYRWMIEDERLEIKSPLLKAKELFHRRSRKPTCIDILREARNQEYGTIEHPINRSKGAEAISRVAPIGLAFYNNPKRAFEVGCEVAAITHSHPTAYYSAGALCSMIACLASGQGLTESTDQAIKILEHFPAGRETMEAVKDAKRRKEEGNPGRVAIAALGLGFEAQEALAIGIYCALCYEEDFKRAICLSVNHDGDSDSTAMVCGTLLGAKLGIMGLVPEWIKQVEGENLILEMANLLYTSYAS